MPAIKLNHGNAADYPTSCDLIVTDPPFDMGGPELSSILSVIDCNHLVLITTMKQLIELVSCSEWSLNFDFVLDAVIPKKSKSIHQPNYTHATGVYLTRNNPKSLFSRKRRQRSDTFDNNGYWPTIIRAPRERIAEHGMAKNQQALKDIIGSFDVASVYDPFAGSGTIGFVCFELDIDCEMTELDSSHFEKLTKEFGFLL